MQVCTHTHTCLENYASNENAKQSMLDLREASRLSEPPFTGGPVCIGSD